MRPKATLPELQALALSTYSRVWRDWYSARADCTMATLTVDVDGTSAGYSHKHNLIIVSIGEGNLEDHDLLDNPVLNTPSSWSIWMPDLIHEMLHEYEMKVIITPTPDGEALFAAFPHPFYDSKDHGPLFYSAIVDRAPYFALTPRQLLEEI